MSLKTSEKKQDHSNDHHFNDSKRVKIIEDDSDSSEFDYDDTYRIPYEQSPAPKRYTNSILKPNKQVQSPDIASRTRSQTPTSSTPSSDTSTLTNILQHLQQTVSEFGGHSSTKNFKKAPIPNFHGSPKDNIQNWIFLLENRFEADHIHDNDTVDIAAGYLRDLALEIYRNMRTTAKPSWNELRDRMLRQFQTYRH